MKLLATHHILVPQYLILINHFNLHNKVQVLMVLNYMDSQIVKHFAMNSYSFHSFIHNHITHFQHLNCITDMVVTRFETANSLDFNL